MKARLERDTCDRCGKQARVISVRSPWQTVTAFSVVTAGAAFLILGQTQPVPWADLTATLPLRLAWFALIAIVGGAFATWGARVRKTAALSRGRELAGVAT